MTGRDTRATSIANPSNPRSYQSRAVLRGMDEEVKGMVHPAMYVHRGGSTQCGNSEPSSLNLAYRAQ